MGFIGVIFGIIIAVIVIAAVIRNLDPKNGSSLQNILNRGLANILGEQNNSVDTSEVKIYDENGNVINFQSNVPDNSSQDVIIYDEDGNVMAAKPLAPKAPLLNKNDEIPESTTSEKAIHVVEETEANADAEMYHEFITSNGGSAIVIQEILGKPVALRK
jgi:hypothetical protein